MTTRFENTIGDLYGVRFMVDDQVDSNTIEIRDNETLCSNKDEFNILSTMNADALFEHMKRMKIIDMRLALGIKKNPSQQMKAIFEHLKNKIILQKKRTIKL